MNSGSELNQPFKRAIWEILVTRWVTIWKNTIFWIALNHVDSCIRRKLLSYWYQKLFHIHKKVLIRPLISKFKFLKSNQFWISQAELNKIFAPQINVEVDLNDSFMQICNKRWSTRWGLRWWVWKNRIFSMYV